jgi:hypothetical protein
MEVFWGGWAVEGVGGGLGVGSVLHLGWERVRGMRKRCVGERRQ